MTLNPFIELFRNPVGALAWLGYVLLMVGVIVFLGSWGIRQGATLIRRWQRNRHSEAWWSFGDSSVGYIPPLGWLTRACGVFLVAAIVVWALGTLVWLVGV